MILIEKVFTKIIVKILILTGIMVEEIFIQNNFVKQMNNINIYFLYFFISNKFF